MSKKPGKTPKNSGRTRPRSTDAGGGGSNDRRGYPPPPSPQGDTVKKKPRPDKGK